MNVATPARSVTSVPEVGFTPVTVKTTSLPSSGNGPVSTVAVTVCEVPIGFCAVSGVSVSTGSTCWAPGSQFPPVKTKRSLSRNTAESRMESPWSSMCRTRVFVLPPTTGPAASSKPVVPSYVVPVFGFGSDGSKPKLVLTSIGSPFVSNAMFEPFSRATKVSLKPWLTKSGNSSE